MADRHDKRSCACVCNCSSDSDDTNVNQEYISTHILGNSFNSVDLYVSTPSNTKWIFNKKMEEEMKNERTRTS